MRPILYLLLLATSIFSAPLFADSYNVSAPSTSTGSYTVTWTNSSSSYFTLQERRNGGSWVDIMTSSTYTYKSFNKAVGGVYDYRIKHSSPCYRYCSNGPYYYYYSSIDTTNVTITNGVKPSAPSNLAGPSNDNDGVFSVYWNPPNDIVDYYTLQQQKNGGSWTTVGTTEASVIWLTNMSNGTYKYRVRSCNTNGCGSYNAYFNYNGSVNVSINTSAPVTISYGYDELGRLEVVSDSKAGGSTFTYDDAGNRVQVTTNNDKGKSN